MSGWKVGSHTVPIQPFVDAAIAEYGFVKPDKADAITAWIVKQHEASSWDVRRLRREGTELSNEEKKAAGLDMRAKFTREALDLLTEKGRENPIDNLETTLRYVVWSILHVARRRQLAEFFTSTASYNLYLGAGIVPAHDACEQAKLLAGKVFDPRNALPVLPLVRCERSMCGCDWRIVRVKERAAGLQPVEAHPISTGWVMKALPDETPAPSPKRSWFARLFRR